jgi:hypothetical protein
METIDAAIDDIERSVSKFYVHLDYCRGSGSHIRITFLGAVTLISIILLAAEFPGLISSSKRPMGCMTICRDGKLIVFNPVARGYFATDTLRIPIFASNPVPTTRFRVRFDVLCALRRENLPVHLMSAEAEQNNNVG